MDCLQFEQRLRDGILLAIREFCSQHPGETPYGFALILGQCGSYLGCAIATEEGLSRIADQYVERGYRYEGFDWQEVAHAKELAVWLRWAHPDDGWYYEDFPSQLGITDQLKDLVLQNAFGDQAGQLEAFCTDVLTSLQTDVDWQQLVQRRPIIVGVYEGNDPRNFLRTATRCNPYAIVRQLWQEQSLADESSSRIKSPYHRAN